MTSSESDGQTRPKKRSRTSTSGDDGGSKKARGRPRVDTQDATAQDRRRTQIRLAQRAYRQRKETTISSLKKRNAQLQGIIDQMNKSFLRFHDSAIQSGLLQLNSSLAQDMKNVTETFVALAKTASEGDIDGEEDAVDAPMDHAAEMHNASVSARDTRQDAQPENHVLPQATSTDIGWGYTMNSSEASSSVNTYPDILQASTFLPAIPSMRHDSDGASSLIRRQHLPVSEVLNLSRTATHTNVSSQQLPFGLVEVLGREPNPYTFGHAEHSVFNVNIPSPKTNPVQNRLPSPPLMPNPSGIPSLSTQTIKSPWTYSYDETTFARRLNRAGLEAGFRLLNNAAIRPAALNHVFKLSLPYMTLDQLRERFRMLLSRGVNEDLDCWETPFIHLGGAGTHYPRKDAQGHYTPIPNSWTVRSIGPLSARMIRAENSDDPSLSHDLNLDLTGFEGEWLDSHDVQGYLEETKGCIIDPRDSFAEVLVEVEDELPTEEPPTVSSLLYPNKPVDFGYSAQRQRSAPLPSSSSTTLSTSHQSTPGHGSSAVSSLFASDSSFSFQIPNNPNFPSDFSKFSAMDPLATFEQPLGLDLAPAFENSFVAQVHSSNFGQGMDSGSLGLDLIGGADEPLPIVKQKAKKPALVDITRLVDEIIKHCVCLGRAPGFRRKDVDKAFKASLVSAY